MRCQQLTRSYQVIALLRAWGGVSLAQLAGETGVTIRTIRRDLEALQAAGVPVTDAVSDTGVRRWRLVKGASCPLCGFHR